MMFSLFEEAALSNVLLQRLSTIPIEIDIIDKPAVTKTEKTRVVL